MKNNSIITGFMLMFLLIGIMIVTADQQTLGKDFIQFQNINLVQHCDNSSYSNISRLIYPNGTMLINSELSMTKKLNDYNYTITNYLEIGESVTYGHCDLNGVDTGWVYNFFTKPSGIFGIDFGNPIYLILGILFFVASVFLAFVKEYAYSGAMLLIFGAMLLMSRINIVISIIVIASAVILTSKGTYTK